MDKYLSRKLTVLKSLAIVLVVLIHTRTVERLHLLPPDSTFSHKINSFMQEFFCNGLNRVAVPLFFLISGYLFFINFSPTWEGFKKKVLSRTRTLLIPCVLVSSVCVVLYFVFQAFPLTARYFGEGKPLVYYSNSELILQLIKLEYPAPGQLWFIRSLFVMVLLSPLLYWCLSRTGFFFIFGITCLWLCLGTESIGYSIINRNIEGLFFFVCGAFIALKKIDVQFKIVRPYWFILLWVILVFAKTSFTLYNHIWSWNLHKLSIVAGVLAIWFNYNIVERVFGEKLIFIAPYAFAVYLFHVHVLIILNRVSQVIINGSEFLSFISYFLLALGAIVVSIVIVRTLKVLVPRAYGILVGQRDVKNCN